jgi:hypothetical protein
LVTHLTFDDEYLKERALRQKKEIPKHLGEGLLLGRWQQLLLGGCWVVVGWCCWLLLLVVVGCRWLSLVVVGCCWLLLFVLLFVVLKPFPFVIVVPVPAPASCCSPSGAKDIGRGLYDGVTGLVVQPYRGYRKQGAKGFGIGVLKGLAGCIVKPTAGAMDMVTHTFQGIKGTAGALDG